MRDSEEVRSTIADAVLAIDKYLDRNAVFMSNEDYRTCEEFVFAAGDARRAFKGY